MNNWWIGKIRKSFSVWQAIHPPTTNKRSWNTQCYFILSESKWLVSLLSTLTTLVIGNNMKKMDCKQSMQVSAWPSKILSYCLLVFLGILLNLKCLNRIYTPFNSTKIWMLPWLQYISFLKKQSLLRLEIIVNRLTISFGILK